MNSREAEEAMPLDAFIDETIAVFETDASEILVRHRTIPPQPRSR